MASSRCAGGAAPGRPVNHKENRMLRSALISVAALGVIASAASAQGKMDCGALYKNTLVKFHADKAASLPPDKLANAHRIALRAYDACSAGDEFNATQFYQQLAEEAQ